MYSDFYNQFATHESQTLGTVVPQVTPEVAFKNWWHVCRLLLSWLIEILGYAPQFPNEEFSVLNHWMTILCPESYLLYSLELICSKTFSNDMSVWESSQNNFQLLKSPITLLYQGSSIPSEDTITKSYLTQCLLLLQSFWTTSHVTFIIKCT